MAEDERQELIERFRIAHAEYRAEVALGWDRTKFFLTINPLLTAWMATSTAPKYAAQLALSAAALVACAGLFVVHRSHTRYQAARAVLQRLEDELGFADFRTTGGQRAARGELRLESFRVVDVVMWVFVLIALFDLALALFWTAR